MNPIVINVSKRLKIARIASGYKTAKEFTEKYNIPTSTYCQHEGAKRALSIENLLNYAELTNVDPAWLLTGEGNPCGIDGNKEVEQKILDEIIKSSKKGEIELNQTPQITLENKFSNVNVVVLRNIFLELLPLLKYIPNVKMEEAINFCFDLYNKIISVDTDDKGKSDLIRMCLESFFKGMGVNITDELIEKIAMAS